MGIKGQKWVIVTNQTTVVEFVEELKNKTGYPRVTCKVKGRA